MKISPQAKITLFFALTQILGIITGITLVSAAAENQELKEMTIAPLEADDPMNALVFFLYILLGAAIVILASRFFKGKLFFRLLELIVISSSSSIVFFALAMQIMPDWLFSALAAGFLGFLLGIAKFIKDGLKNAAALISSAGVAAIFGYSLGFLPTVIFVILLSIYDYISVFKTKHMILMAKELSSRQLSFSITAKSLPERKPNEKQSEYVQRAMKEGERLDLGTGDLSVPAMMSVSAYSLGANGILYSLAIAAGSTAAIYLLLSFVAKKRVFLPALPPICLGGLASFLVAKLAGF